MHATQMNVKKRKKGRPNRNRGYADRISALPDSVLCHILSFLPTKHAVATSVIARRWKNVWTALPNLSFDDRLCLRPPASTYVPVPRFADFVHTVLLRTNPAKVGKFFLYCSRPTNLSRFYAWISSALKRDVREIELYLGQQTGVELPEEIYSAVSLQVLRLHSDVMLQVPYVGTCFPSLKILSVRLDNPENTVAENLFCNCPSLEELSIIAELHDDAPPSNFIISSSTLKRCKFSVRIEDNLFTEVDYSLTITAPNLEWLEIYSDVLGSYVMRDLDSLKKVILHIFHGEWAQVNPYRAIQLLAGINCCKYLHIDDGVISAINHACDSCFPSFDELNYLEMRFGAIGWRVLPIVLRSSPKLQTVVLHKECWFEFTAEQFGWLESERVADCLVHTVKNIEIKGVQGDEDELPLLKYLLKFAASLDTMRMWIKASIPTTEHANLQHIILQLPRASMQSTIEIS